MKRRLVSFINTLVLKNFFSILVLNSNTLTIGIEPTVIFPNVQKVCGFPPMQGSVLSKIDKVILVFDNVTESDLSIRNPSSEMMYNIRLTINSDRHLNRKTS